MADVETTIVGAVWVRIMDDYGHVDETEEEYIMIDTHLTPHNMLPQR